MKIHSRRDALKTMGIGLVAGLTEPASLFSDEGSENKKTHFITLSFDDGFKKSSIQTAEIYEKYNLSACINVIATAHLPGFELPNEYHRWPVGDFGLWNELKQRGHEIMMHGYKHAHKNELSFEQGKDLILRCIDFFSKELKGFEPKESIFNFPLMLPLRNWKSGANASNGFPHRGAGNKSITT